MSTRSIERNVPALKRQLCRGFALCVAPLAGITDHREPQRNRPQDERRLDVASHHLNPASRRTSSAIAACDTHNEEGGENPRTNAREGRPVGRPDAA
ncbi:MAG: hypothetical protein EHM55_15605 [Acidobacteria bacterium]|nr:MAG: hypothetical protein EHM55_15605 [Acidobacteriota bacterium]